MPLRALLLDLGNVLVFHDNDLLFRKLGEKAGLSGVEVERRLFGSTWDGGNRGTLDAEGIRWNVCRALGIDLPLPEFAEVWSCHFTPNESIFPLLEPLSRTHRLVLVSNTNFLHWEFLKPRLPILQKFHSCVASCAVGHIKPEPAIYEIALKRAGCAPNEAIFFDDIEPYVSAAQALGIDGAVFTTTERFREQLKERGIVV